VRYAAQGAPLAFLLMASRPEARYRGVGAVQLSPFIASANLSVTLCHVHTSSLLSLFRWCRGGDMLALRLNKPDPACTEHDRDAVTHRGAPKDGHCSHGSARAHLIASGDARAPRVQLQGQVQPVPRRGCFANGQVGHDRGRRAPQLRRRLHVAADLLDQLPVRSAGGMHTRSGWEHQARGTISSCRTRDVLDLAGAS